MNQIKIDPERIVSDIDRNIFGGYMELGSRDTEFKHLNPGDSLPADKNRLTSDVRSALERVKLPHIRFGGNFFSGYRWQDGVGPWAERPGRHELAWNSIVSNHFGTNEFIMLCRAFNAEPYLNVNGGDGDMREAADWVEYCNGTGDTALTKLRRKHGFEEPHKVKYWGIGNEVDGQWQIGYKTPQEYAREYTEFSKVMKRVDPDIKLIASGASFWQDSPQRGGPRAEWVERVQLMLEQAGDRIDYMALHKYAHPFNDDPFESYMAFAASYNEHLSAYEGIIRAVSLERGIKHAIPIAVDEWGIIHTPFMGETPINVNIDKTGHSRLTAGENGMPPKRGRTIISLTDALVTALHLNAFIRHAYSVRLANYTSMPTPACLSFPNPESTVLMQTVFYPFELYSRTCGQLALDVFWSGDTFSGTYKDRAYTGIRALDVSATLDAGRKQLVVYVVNQSKDKAMETTIALSSGQFAGNVKAAVVNGPDVTSENTQENPNQVGTKEAVLKVAGKSFNYTFEPHSVTALVCAIS